MARRTAEQAGGSPLRGRIGGEANGKKSTNGKGTKNRPVWARWKKSKTETKQTEQPTKDQLHDYIDSHMDAGHLRPQL